MVRGTRTGLALGAVVLMVGAALTPSAAQAADGSAEVTTITTFGYVPTDGAGEAALSDVQAQIAEAESFEAVDVPLAAPHDSSRTPSASPRDLAAKAAADPAYRIVSTWTDKIAKPTVARAGNVSRVK